MMPDNRFLPEKNASELLRFIESSAIRTEYDPERHRLMLLDEAGHVMLHFRLPLSLAYPAVLPEKTVSYVILLIQAGNCALGYFENGRCLDHKVFRSYMVRKKQGKSQIKYLKTKGKSRAGSRVRLGETEEFFANINTRLQDYFRRNRIDRIAISCSKTLLPFLYTASVATPFDKRDPRLFKIPRHVHTPIYEVLLNTNRFLQRGELIYEETEQEYVETLLAAADLQFPTAAEIQETDMEEEWDEVYIDPDREDEPDYLVDDEDEEYW